MALANAAIDMAPPGPANEAWLRLLDEQPLWEPDGTGLLVVAPHPDDETLGAGGLIASVARRQKPVTVVSVTDGEVAYSNWSGLAAIRRAELKRALHNLSPHMILQVRLGLPDGGVRRHERLLRQSLTGLVTKGVVLVAPYEQDGHPDHDVVGRVCLEVARAHTLSIVRYPIRAWRLAAWHALRQARWGRFELSAEAREAKHRAIGAFVSQLRPPFRQPRVPEDVVPYFERPYEAFLL